MGGDFKNAFKFENASSYLLVHSNLSFFFSVANKWKVFSHERKQDRAARCPVSCWTSLTLERIIIPMMVWHLYAFTSMPLWVKMKLRNLSACTPNERLAGFNRMCNSWLTLWYLQSLLCDPPFLKSSLSYHQCKPPCCVLFILRTPRPWVFDRRRLHSKPQRVWRCNNIFMIGHECCLACINMIHLNLVVSKVGVHETHDFITWRFINQTIYIR